MLKTLSELSQLLAEITLSDSAITMLSGDESDWRGELTQVSWDAGSDGDPADQPYVWLYTNSSN